MVLIDMPYFSDESESSKVQSWTRLRLVWVNFVDNFMYNFWNIFRAISRQFRSHFGDNFDAISGTIQGTISGKITGKFLRKITILDRKSYLGQVNHWLLQFLSVLYSSSKDQSLTQLMLVWQRSPRLLSRPWWQNFALF